MQTHPLYATDELLFAQDLTDDEKIVLAALLGSPTRDPSLAEIAKASGLHETTILVAATALQWPGSVQWGTFDKDTGEVVFLRRHDPRLRYTTPGVPLFGRNERGELHISPPTMLLDRPKTAHDRNRTNPRFTRTNHLIYVESRFDPRSPKNAARRIELPGTIVAKLRRGTGVRNAALIRLVALVYARDQLRRGAIQAEDLTVAHLLGCKPRQVARIRRDIIADGILVPERGQRNVYTMPGATPASDKTAADFDPADTRRVYSTPNRATIYATESQLAEVERLHAWIDQDAYEEAFEAADEIVVYGDGWHFAEAEITLCRRLLAPAPATPSDLRKGSSLPLEGVIESSRRGGTSLPTTYDLPTSSASADEPTDREPTPSAGDEEHAETEEQEPRRPKHPKHDYGPEWFSTFLFADTGTNDRLLRLRDALEGKYGHAEAAGFWRAACREHGPLGSRALAFLGSRFPHLDPRAAELEDPHFLDALLDAPAEPLGTSASKELI